MIYQVGLKHQKKVNYFEGTKKYFCLFRCKEGFSHASLSLGPSLDSLKQRSSIILCCWGRPCIALRALSLQENLSFNFCLCLKWGKFLHDSLFFTDDCKSRIIRADCQHISPPHLLPWVFVLTQCLASLELPQSNYTSGKLGHPWSPAWEAICVSAAGTRVEWGTNPLCRAELSWCQSAAWIWLRRVCWACAFA